jgi:hypothetical protein
MTQDTGGKRSINGLLIGGAAALALAVGLLGWKGLTAKAPAVEHATIPVEKKEKTGADAVAQSPPMGEPAMQQTEGPMSDEDIVAAPAVGAWPKLEPPAEPVILSEAATMLAEVERRAAENPEATAAWVEKMPAGEARDEAIAFVVYQWAQKDPEKAASWQEHANALPEEEE